MNAYPIIIDDGLRYMWYCYEIYLDALENCPQPEDDSMDFWSACTRTTNTVFETFNPRT